ncbi:4-(cytidine 5'-diphospho)-2-C-methyl-D-erythritol kinase [Litorimonas sp. WD9-15]|uniref:4-(cytidine 5'-diphospho)-2-C-methyl-D-erythritol kinase n=1 Tax=Litorimonas sp. WD9-15 TaxID=3418716 RepID=UPI003D08E62E
MSSGVGNKTRTETARAKVNLTLHVGAVRADEYHPLDSLVVFADIGDHLTFTPVEETRLTITGADDLPTGPDNLILRAMTLAQAAPHHIHLQKNLPVSAGLGGGSANAGAVLRMFENSMSDHDLAYQLGADIPVCRWSRTAMMRGIGEEVELLPGLGQLSAVLVNPGVAVSTGVIFKSMDAKPRAAEPKPNATSGDLLSLALAGVNDMQDFAIAQAPVISDVLRALAQQPDCQLARMSGSGATCFGIFRSDAQAVAFATSLSAAQPDWWVRACKLGDAA